MRRGSLIGPFLLIGIGGILLVNNLRPELSLLEMAAAYWPLLLIIWGGLRLIELLVASSRGKPLPQAGITGGEWTLIILICLFGSGTNFARSHWPHARFTMHGLEMFGESYDFQIAGREEAGPAPRVIIENLRGNVRVIGDDTSEVKVEGRTTVKAFEQSDAEEANAKCPLELVRHGDQIIVRTNHDRLGETWKVTTDLEVTVPTGSSVEGRARSGDFDIANLAGSVDIKSDNAGVRLAEIGGDARIDLRRSDIIRIVRMKGAAELTGRGEDVELDGIGGRVNIKGSYSGELLMKDLAQPMVFESKRTQLSVARVLGRLRMALGVITAENLTGPIHLKTTSRDVQLSDFTGQLEMEIDRGDVELRPGETLSPMTVGVRSGDIMLAVSESAPFSIEATTKNGETINEFGPGLSVETLGNRGSKMVSAERVQPSIKLDTVRGDIVVRRIRPSPESETPQRLEMDSAQLRLP